MPDPSTGRALLVVGGRRALYDAASVGVGTASLGILFIGLLGFYFVGNSLAHDLRTRVGTTLASTPLSTPELMAGKLLGHLAALGLVTGGYALGTFVMLLVRAEAGVDPLLFAWQFAVLLPSTLVTVSMAALLFESVRWLSGRGGDVLWFVLWIGIIGWSATASIFDLPRATLFFDLSGFGYLTRSLSEGLATKEIAIGATSFDPNLAPLQFGGLELGPEWWLPRLTSTLLPLLLFPLACWSFHRFDPARARGPRKVRSAAAAGEGRLGRLRRRALDLLGGRGAGSLIAAGRFEAASLLRETRWGAAGLLGALVLPWLVSGEAFRRGVLPALFALFALAAAPAASREARAGTRDLVGGVAGVAGRELGWKALAVAWLAAGFLASSALRALVGSGALAAAGVMVGAAVLGSAAVLLGRATDGPRPFFVLFLCFWYLVLDDQGRTPALDLAAFHGAATPAVLGAWAFAAAAGLLLAVVVERLRRRLASDR